MRDSWLVLVVAVLVLPVSSGADWHGRTVSGPHFIERMSPGCVALDGTGGLHMAYGGDHLYHAWLHQGTWYRETVDGSPDVGRQASLAIGPGGVIHIAYSDDANGAVRYAVGTGGSWEIQELVSGPQRSHAISLALDSHGEPGVAYFDRSAGELRVKHRAGMFWRNHLAATGLQSALALELDFLGDDPHVAYGSYLAGEPQTLQYAYWDGLVWQRATPDPYIDGEASFVSLAIDTGGHAHVAYNDILNSRLRYVTFVPGGWPGIPETVDDTRYAGWYPSIRVDSQDRPWISCAGHLSKLALYRRVGAVWSLIEGPDTVDNVYASSLLLDGADQPRVACLDHPSGRLLHAHYQGSGWDVDTVDVGSWVGGLSDLALDSAGRPCLAYSIYPQQTLGFARDEVDWALELVDVTGGAAGGLSIALDALDGVHLSYGQFSSRLVYARSIPGGWAIEQVDPDGNGGDESSLALDSAGRPHIAYSDDGQDHLKYAHHDGTDWVIETVDTEGDLGRYVSLALDGQDRPHVAYFDGDQDDLRYAHHESGGWSIEVVDSQGSVGDDCALVLDGAGRPRIAYRNYAQSTVMYASHDGTGWTRETLPGGGQVFALSNLVLDRSDEPQLCYVDHSDMQLWWATRSGGAWTTEQVSPDQRVGHAVSLRLDRDQQPHIGYLNDGTGDLDYAIRRQGIWTDLVMSDLDLAPGDPFRLVARTGNDGIFIEEVDQYILLEASGEYWFWPSWTQTPDMRTGFLPGGLEDAETILEFIWPAGYGSGSGIRFWGGHVRTGTVELASLDWIDWGWSP